MSDNQISQAEKKAKADQFLEVLEAILRPEIRQIIEAASTGFSNGEYVIEVPDANQVDLTIEEMASVVARTSNAYSKIARLSGMAKAQQKISEARFKRLYKVSKTGRNDDEREASAMEASSAEFSDLAVVEATVEIADALERAARVASESSRKIYDRVVAQATAERRAAGIEP
jgi:pyruvate formate-lyase activating enzyme-like uncharacterized protein